MDKKALGCAKNRACRANVTGKRATQPVALLTVITIVLFASGCIGLTSKGSAQNPDNPLSGIVLTPNSVSFGPVRVGSNASQSVTVTNKGTASVVLSSAAAPNGVKVAGISFPVTLAPGKDTSFDLVFTPNAAGAVTGNVTLRAGSANVSNGVAITGDGIVGHTVSLAWTATGGVGYNVYRSEVSGGPYTKLDAQLLNAASYVDAAVKAGLTYFYVVTSVDSSGVESAASAQASATVPIP
jgi:hypothetical protein